MLLLHRLGCLGFSPYERKEMGIHADSLLEVEFSVATNEILDGTPGLTLYPP